MRHVDILSTTRSYDSIYQGQILSSDIDYYDKYVCANSADNGVIQIVDNE